MRPDNRLSAELLRQDGLAPGQISENERKEILTMLELQWKRTRRMKWIMIGSWVVSASVLLVFSLIDAVHHEPNSTWFVTASVIWRSLFLIAVVMTISYYVRFRSVSMTEIRFRLAEIESKLRNEAK